ncbi:hypothetical protein [Breoghania sp. L-A4]|uniref:hypothetical protein n=1 Tax=Breoghania sp. L-A4 TaxID=2304600 RepID=UPI000E358826|nr:hypothetical protein [Breoghania sp. L-A4]AXS38942.1 hypothetical protein D1F64_01260 [Breoghania sp. L-A4]
MTTDSLRAIRTPVSIAAVGRDTEAPSDLCAEWVHGILPNSTFALLDPEAGHYVFFCTCSVWGQSHMPDICRDAPGVDRRVIHDGAAALALDLFA